MARAYRLGLTGGIGSGKSTVAACLAQCGAAVIDADAIARSVTAPGGLAIVPIREKFGSDLITASGALDREAMRTLVFADQQAKQALEAIVHPLVSQDTWRQAEALENAGHRCLVFDVPLLVESNRWRTQVDAVLVVDCSPQTQIERVMARSGLAREAVQAIMAAQSPRLRRLQAADAVIFNDGIPLEVLRQQAHTLAPGFGLSSTATTAPQPTA